MIVIEIHNAEEVANQKSWFKTLIGKTFGVDIHRKVQEELVKQIKVELERQGVKADVSIK